MRGREREMERERETETTGDNYCNLIHTYKYIFICKCSHTACVPFMLRIRRASTVQVRQWRTFKFSSL